MGKIVLIRHGESTANRDRHFTLTDDVPLTDAGRRQAREASVHVTARFKPAAVLCSHFARARETGEIIAASLGMNVRIFEGIHERHFGCLRGQPYARYDELADAGPEAHLHWAPPGGESRSDLQRRVMPALGEIVAGYPDEEVLVVCHGAVIQSVWAHLSGMWDGAPVPVNCGMVLVEHRGMKLGLPEMLVG